MFILRQLELDVVLKYLLNFLPFGYIGFNSNIGKIVYPNKKVSELFEIKNSLLLRCKIKTFISEDYQDAFFISIREIIKSESECMQINLEDIDIKSLLDAVIMDLDQKLKAHNVKLTSFYEDKRVTCRCS